MATNDSIVGAARTPDYAAQAQEIYKNTFGREGDAEGVNYWAGKLASGASVADVTGQVKDAAKGTYQNYLTNPNAYGADIGNVLSKDLQAGATPGQVAGSTTKQMVKNGINPGIYEQLYGKDPQQPAQQQPSIVQAAGYTPAKLGNPTAWNVTPEQTVEGRINGILNAESPIIQMARTRAKESANERGLLNTSMGAQAGEMAAYSAALPIAQADAATFAKASGYNADMKNQFDVRNVDSLNSAGQFNANAQNVLTGQQLSANTQRTIAELETQTRTSLAYLDAQTKTNLANMDAGTRTQLATIEANYKGLMQSNASASDLYRQVTQNIMNISLSKEMDGPAKQTAVNNQIQLLKNGMSINGAIANLNLSDLLDFSVDATAPAAATSTTPAAATEQAGGV
jgi:hypothetical protein